VNGNLERGIRERPFHGETSRPEEVGGPTPAFSTCFQAKEAKQSRLEANLHNRGTGAAKENDNKRRSRRKEANIAQGGEDLPNSLGQRRT